MGTKFGLEVEKDADKRIISQPMIRILNQGKYSFGIILFAIW